MARAQQLRVDVDDVRRLHPRTGDREPAAGACCGYAEDECSQPAPLDGGLDTAACRRSRTIRHPGTTAALVTESDAETLVAQPVHITVNRDIGGGPRDG